MASPPIETDVACRFAERASQASVGALDQNRAREDAAGRHGAARRANERVLDLRCERFRVETFSIEVASSPALLAPDAKQRQKLHPRTREAHASQKLGELDARFAR